MMTEENKTVLTFLGFLLDFFCFSMNKKPSGFNNVKEKLHIKNPPFVEAKEAIYISF